MYDIKYHKLILDDLEDKAIKLADTIVALNSQGYLVNNIKIAKLNVASILIRAFENVDIFNHRQRNNIEVLYNNFFNV